MYCKSGIEKEGIESLGLIYDAFCDFSTFMCVFIYLTLSSNMEYSFDKNMHTLAPQNYVFY